VQGPTDWTHARDRTRHVMTEAIRASRAVVRNDDRAARDSVFKIANHLSVGRERGVGWR
jgi:hypothetical protein